MLFAELGTDLLKEPCLGQRPPSIHRGGEDAEGRGGLRHRHAAEEATLYDAGLPLAVVGEARVRVVQFDEPVVPRVG